MFAVTIEAFAAGGAIPGVFTCEGDNFSTLALSVDDRSSSYATPAVVGLDPSFIRYGRIGKWNAMSATAWSDSSLNRSCLQIRPRQP